jgi:hypothetical protein
VIYHGHHKGAKSLITIDAGMLREPMKNPSGLVPLECPIGLELVLEDPLAGDNIHSAEPSPKCHWTLGRCTLPP